MPGDFGPLEDSLQAIPAELGVTPRAILAVSGHWEAPEFTVQTHAHPPMLYDYGGFPEFTYHLHYPAPGSPEVAARVGRPADGSRSASPHRRPAGLRPWRLRAAVRRLPEADVPILQLSIKSGYDPATHLAAGRALAPLRDEGVLIVGSGFSFHNLRAFGAAGARASAEFDRWLTPTLVDDIGAARSRRLLEWDRAPSARASHPSEDHLIPLMVAVGAAEDERGVRTYHQDDFMGSITASSFRFGPNPREQAAAAASNDHLHDAAVVNPGL